MYPTNKPIEWKRRKKKKTFDCKVKFPINRKWIQCAMHKKTNKNALRWILSWTRIRERKKKSSFYDNAQLIELRATQIKCVNGNMVTEAWSINTLPSYTVSILFFSFSSSWWMEPFQSINRIIVTMKNSHCTDANEKKNDGNQTRV